MKSAVLCGHTGSNNHGCEAIIRSTAEIFKENGISVSISSFNIDQDLNVGLDSIGQMIGYRHYRSKISFSRIYNGIQKKIFHNEYYEQRYIQRNVFKNIKKSDAAVIVGGDTYCYNRNSRLVPYYTNKFANMSGKPSFLWSCSIGKENIDDEMIRDLKNYTMIFPREIVTYRNMLDIGIEESRLFLMSDSAFTLKTQSVNLSNEFENVFAYNPSYSLKRTKNILPEVVESARYKLIEYILNNTDMKIALIPHVYYNDFGDIEVCREIYNKYKTTGRVFIFDENYNCMQLKYIISKCRFLIAERTHASIAGYSSCVPTFVLGYSVKAKGIAEDIFGDYKDYVLSVQDLENVSIFINKIKNMIKNEEQIKSRLINFMPEYINRAEKAGEKISQLI